VCIYIYIYIYIIYINVQEFNIWKNYNLEVYVHLKLCMHEHFDLIINLFKYKCKISQIFVHLFQNIMLNAKCNSWIVNFIIFKVSDSTHVKILVVQEMWKHSLKHSSIIAKYWVACVIVYNKCKMQFVSNDFNILKLNSSTSIIEDMWKNH